MHHLGANTNTVRLFLIPPPDEHLHGLTPEVFVRRINNLDVAGFSGLDPETACRVIAIYIMKYTFKNEKSSASSKTAKRSLATSYYKHPTYSDKRVGNLVGKHMYNVTNLESQTSQQIAFLDGKGLSTCSSGKRPKKWSVKDQL